MRRRVVFALTGAAVAVAGGVALVPAGAAGAATPSVDLQTVADIGTDGRTLAVSVLTRCDPVAVPGASERVYLTVTQLAVPARAQGFARVPCDGDVHSIRVTLTTVSFAPLVPGVAIGSATIAGSSGAANNAPGQQVELVS
jgi:hypothetical protein